mgnify:CR=1 FL=1
MLLYGIVYTSREILITIPSSPFQIPRLIIIRNNQYNKTQTTKKRGAKSSRLKIKATALTIAAFSVLK